MKAKVVSQDTPKLLDRMRAEIRVRHYSIRTEETYLDWARRFILLHDKRAPLRCLFNVISRRFVTNMDVVFEEVLRATPELKVVSDVPMLANGWFRGIVLRKLRCVVFRWSK